MSALELARALMMRHHHLVKNREQSMLGRSAAEVGLPVEAATIGTTFKESLIPVSERATIAVVRR